MYFTYFLRIMYLQFSWRGVFFDTRNVGILLSGKSRFLIKEKRQYEEEKIFYICEKEIKTGDAIAIDHDHLSQKYRGKAHKVCNVNFRKNYAVQIIFHNFINYDQAFTIKDIASRIKGQIYVIPRNISKYFAVIK